MNTNVKDRLKIIRHLDASEAYFLYVMEDRYFVSFQNGGHGGGERSIEITKETFNELDNRDIELKEAIQRHHSQKTFRSWLNWSSRYSSAVPPDELFKIDNKYFIRVYKREKLHIDFATEISEEEYEEYLKK